MALPLDIITGGINFYDGTAVVTFRAANWELSIFAAGGTEMDYNITIGTLDAANGVFPTLLDAQNYYYSSTAASIVSALNTYLGGSYYYLGDRTVVTTNISDYVKSKITSGTRTQSSLSLSLVGTGATGTQISASNDAIINVTVSTSATATIAGAATSTVALKICATNSATEGNWTTVQTSETSQSYSLAIALQGVTGGKGCLSTFVPAGWYAKLVNSGSGTHAESFISGQKVIFS